MSENESKGFYFYIPAETNTEGTQTRGNLFDRENGEKALADLILKLESLDDKTSFNKRTIEQEYCLFNMEHE